MYATGLLQMMLLHKDCNCYSNYPIQESAARRHIQAHCMIAFGYVTFGGRPLCSSIFFSVSPCFQIWYKCCCKVVYIQEVSHPKTPRLYCIDPYLLENCRISIPWYQNGKYRRVDRLLWIIFMPEYYSSKDEKHIDV